MLIAVFGLRNVDPPAPAGPTGPDAPDGLTPVVTTTGGEARGVTARGVRSWRGIPYAAPPVGRLRWRPPEQPEPWDGVREASSYGAACVQPAEYTFGDTELTQRPGTSEDCLYLNVVRPATQERGLPVVVWLHGGGFFAGNGNTAADEAAELVARGIVLVTVNYRLGRLGFFAHPALTEGVANLGLLDQVAALRWVRDNAAAFGGDADRVTLMGGSAGAMSVNALMAAPSTEGLFDRAIAQSAPSDLRSLTLAQARARGAAAFPGLTAHQLRALPAGRLLDSTFNTLSGDAPILDEFLPEPSAAAFAAGREHAVPYLVGTTTGEFADRDFRSFGVDPDALRASLGGAGNSELVAAYGPVEYEREVLDDLVFDLPALDKAAAHGRLAPTYRYVFGAASSPVHGAEGPYVFDTVAPGTPAGRVADAVADYWVAFARSGRPVGRRPSGVARGRRRHARRLPLLHPARRGRAPGRRPRQPVRGAPRRPGLRLRARRTLRSPRDRAQV